ncbi:hypothetical protein ACFYWO_17375 [Streptomyces sp. NPDC002932]|uniref:hypothetical protein n=1 Tax=Streptomyces sp. NPDC002932 TaxID=3364672 RepID=UPI003695D271
MQLVLLRELFYRLEVRSGRGLLIVAAYSDGWGVGERSPGKVVWSVPQGAVSRPCAWCG